MSELKITKGPYEIVNAGEVNGTSIRVKDKGFIASFHNCNMSVNGDKNALENAVLCLQAFNVAEETGLTPMQMQLEMLRLKHKAEKWDKLETHFFATMEQNDACELGLFVSQMIMPQG